MKCYENFGTETISRPCCDPNKECKKMTAHVNGITGEIGTCQYKTKYDQCNAAACQAAMEDYVSKGWTYGPGSFNVCSDCPDASYPYDLEGNRINR